MPTRLLPLLAVPLLTGCGALLAPRSFAIPIASQPAGATVLYRGQPIGSTPCEVTIQRSSTELELRLEGYNARSIDVGKAPNPWMAGNILNLGLGVIVDHAFGTHQNPITDPVVARLNRSEQRPFGPWVRRIDETTITRRETSGAGHLLGALLQTLASL